MKLFIDFGNSHCKWATLNDVKWRSGTAIPYENNDSVAKVDRLINVLPVEQSLAIHAVNVLGQDFAKNFSNAVAKQTSAKLTFYSAHSNKYGLQLGYADPTTYGADRYAALVAAHHRQEGAKIVIDCGTAITIDVVVRDGSHKGGLIIPSSEVMCSSLAQLTTGITFDESPLSVEYLNNTTASAVYSGSTLCLQHGLPSIIQNIQSMIEERAAIMVTGGARANILDMSSKQYLDCPDLVLEGLEIMQR